MCQRIELNILQLGSFCIVVMSPRSKAVMRFVRVFFVVLLSVCFVSIITDEHFSDADGAVSRVCVSVCLCVRTYLLK